MIQSVIFPIIFVSLAFSAALGLKGLPGKSIHDVEIPPLRLDKISVGLEDKATAPQTAAYRTPANSYLLSLPAHTYQTFNNCGPATLSMLLAYYGTQKSQKELGQLMRPYQNPKGINDDKSIFSTEFIEWAQNYGLKGFVRPAGNLELIKTLVANDIPVVVRTWLRLGEDIGHYRIVRGFDDDKQVIIEDDSYFGPKRPISYKDFLAMWQPFNYEYFVIYDENNAELIKAILAGNFDEQFAWEQAHDLASRELAANPANFYPHFNLVAALYHLGRYEEAARKFEEIEGQMPPRMLWYQLEPILAYTELGEHERVFAMTDTILKKGNRAFSELYQIRGEIYLSQGKIEDARAEFESAVLYNKNFKPAVEALAKLNKVS